MALYQEVLDELAEMEVDDRTLDLVMASLEGGEAVERVLDGEPLEYSGAGQDGGDEQASSIYLHDIAVEGFRGIGPEVRLELPPGPGLTVVVGRNGSGKSSFAEALEVLLTGNALRWEDRSGPWKEGWRNLHDGDSPRISARFQVAGKRGLTTVGKSWAGNDGFDAVSSTAQHRGEKRTDLAGIGWEDPLDLYRPLLSYNELGMIGARPSELFDTLAAVLGLEPIDAALKALAGARLERAKLDKQVKKDLEDLIIPALAEVEDDRAELARSLLGKRVWDLDALVRIGSVTHPDRDALAQLESLRAPEEEEVLQAAARLEDRHDEFSELEGTDLEAADRLVRILELALEHHRGHDRQDCPVCGVGSLDAEWRASTEREIDRRREAAARYRTVQQQLRQAVRAARRLVEAPAIPTVPAVDTTVLRELWKRWGALPADPGQMPDHLLGMHEEVAREAVRVSGESAQLHSRQEEGWAGVFPELMAWEQQARSAVAARPLVKQIRKSEQTLKQVSEALRTARWRPIQAEAVRLWERLRLRSNVELRSVELAGARNRRHVDLRVGVDGTEAQALAVASQGEISCLALSLFFPRAMLPDNPFRFLVIDDPIQAMDPARVDGLARVLADIAADRQLIVFTHDDRLPESMRRLQIRHTCLQVKRRPGSVVQVQEKRNPVVQYFVDARAVVADTDLPDHVARKVIPGFCRAGLEAACIEAIRRRWLGRGEPHAAVDDRLDRAHTLKQKASLALFDDPGRGGPDITRRIAREWGNRLADTFWEANRGAHEGVQGSLKSLIHDCRRLAGQIRSL